MTLKSAAAYGLVFAALAAAALAWQAHQVVVAGTGRGNFFSFFLGPRQHGYGQVVFGAVGVGVGFVATTLLVWRAGSALGRRPVRAAAPPRAGSAPPAP